MIRNDAELAEARLRLEELVTTFLEYRVTTLAKSPRTFALVSPSYTSEIAGLTEAICSYLHVPIVMLPEQAEIALHLKGPQVELGKFAASAVGACLSHFQSGISRIAVAKIGHSKKAATVARKASKLSLSGVGPGSVTLYLDPLEVDDARIQLVQPGTNEAAINELVAGFSDCADGKDDLPAAYMSDYDNNATRYQVFKTVAGIIPSDPSVDNVEIVFARRSDETSDRKIVVTRDIATRAKKWAHKIASVGIRITETGLLRGVDLDKRTVAIGSRPETKRRLPGTYQEELGDRVRALLDSRVQVTGILITRGNRQKIEIEQIEPEEQSAE
jgi:hypothetical protein